MPILASDVIAEAAALLNDTNQVTFTNTNVLPYLIRANRELEVKLVRLGAQVITQIATVTTIPASAVAIEYSPLPSDIVYPMELGERNQGATTDDFIPMSELDFEPSLQICDMLRFWAWRNNNIYFIGCTQPRDVRLVYRRMLSAIVSDTSNEEVIESEPWLAARTAELCARYIGENKIRADDLKIDVLDAWDNLQGMIAKSLQGMRARHRPFQYNGIYYQG